MYFKDLLNNFNKDFNKPFGIRWIVVQLVALITAVLEPVAVLPLLHRAVADSGLGILGDDF